MNLKAYFLDKYGRVTDVARSVGVSPVTIHQWAYRPDKRVPAARCPAIEKATSGAVTCEEMRPDVDWAYLRGTTTRLIEA